MYVLPSSDVQMSTILKNNKPSQYYRLCLLIVKFVRKNNYYDFLYHLFKKKNITDTEIFNRLKLKVDTSEKNTSDLYAKNHSKLMADIILNYIKKANVKAYLDLGCGKCEFTGYIGKYLGLSQDRIFGTDIKDEFEKQWDEERKKNKMITFDYLTPEIPFKNQTYNVITCFMVLHHIEQPKQTIRMIYDALEKDGIFFIREHDTTTDEDKIFADLVHSFYLLKNGGTVEEAKKQRIYYRSASEWKKMICEVGFKELWMSEDSMSVTKNYKAIYIK